ncbi:LysR family nod box-dependent transcriptional activator [Bradyrhizobium sp. GM6.1]
MRFKGLDLNLLVAFDALVTQGNLTAAARSINLSQPAMSAAVARLRTYFRDELFTMRGRKLVPTPRAQALAAPIREALAHIQLSIISPEGFTPSQSNRRFRIILSDFMTVVFLRRIVDRVAREAPTINFELLPPLEEPDELLRRGEVDFLMYPEMFMSSAHPKAALFEDTFVCVGCPMNKQLAPRLTFEKYMSIGHVEARFGGSLRPSFHEWLLLEHGFQDTHRGRSAGFWYDSAYVIGHQPYSEYALKTGQPFRRHDAPAGHRTSAATSHIHRGRPVAGHS